MNIGKWLVAAIVGAVIGGAIWIGIQYATGKELAWLSVLVGVITGMAVRRTGQTGILAGAIAAIISVLGIVTAVQAHSKIMVAKADANNTTFATPAKPAASQARTAAPSGKVGAESEQTDEVADAAASEADEDGATAADSANDGEATTEDAGTDDAASEATGPSLTEPAVTAEPTANIAMVDPNRPTKSEFPVNNLIWFGLAGVVAYVLGRGGDAPRGVATSVTNATGEPETMADRGPTANGSDSDHSANG